MRLTIEVTPEQGAQLFAVAKMTGIDLAPLLRDTLPESEAFLKSLTTASPQNSRDHFYFTASREQFNGALDEIAEMNKELPALPEEAFDREFLYEDRLS